MTNRYPSALVDVLMAAREACAEVRSAMSGAAAQDIPSRPALTEMVEHVEDDRAELLSAAGDLRDIERAIAKALGTTTMERT